MMRLAIWIVIVAAVVAGLVYLGQFWLASGFAMMGVATLSFLLQFEDPVPLLRSCAIITLLGGMALFVSSLFAISILPNLVILTLWACAIGRTIASWSWFN